MKNNGHISRFVDACIDLIILSVIDAHKIGVYDIISKIHSEYGISIKPGRMYPFLSNLKESELIIIENTDNKQVHLLSSKGKKHLETLKENYESFAKKINYEIK